MVLSSLGQPSTHSPCYHRVFATVAYACKTATGLYCSRP